MAHTSLAPSKSYVVSLVEEWLAANPTNEDVFSILDMEDKEALDRIRRIGRNFVNVFSAYDRVEHTVDIVLVTCLLDAANYAKPSFSGTKFEKVGLLSNWGQVIAVMIAAKDKNNLNALKFLASNPTSPEHDNRFQDLAANARTFLGQELSKEEWQAKGFWAGDIGKALVFVQKMFDEFEWTPVSVESIHAKENWCVHYQRWVSAWNAVKAHARFEEFFAENKELSRPQIGLAFGKWVHETGLFDDSAVNIDLFRAIELSIQLVNLIPFFPTNDRQFLNDQGLAEAGNVVALCAPLYAASLKPEKQLESWGHVFQVLLEAPQGSQFVFVMRDYMGGNRDPYSERDMDVIANDIKAFYDRATNSADRIGLSEPQLEAFSRTFIKP